MSAEPHEDAVMARFEAAAEWLERQDELTAEERLEFEAWLETPENARAFQVMGGAMQDTALTEAAARVRSASERAAATVTRLQPARRSAGRTSAYSGWRPLAGLAAAAAVAGVAMIVALNPTSKPAPAPQPVDYATAIGVRKDATLSDKSVLHLDADSKVRVAFSDRARDVRLERGEAMFEVAHDPARPFAVMAGGASVTAVGTMFDVDLLGQAVEVRVFRGVVKVQPPHGNVRFLHAGDRLTLGGPSGLVAGRFAPDQAWRSGWLQADNMPLDYVVARLNRYSRKTIVLREGALSRDRLTGRFDLSRTGEAVAMISALLDLKVAEDRDAIYLSARRAQS